MTYNFEEKLTLNETIHSVSYYQTLFQKIDHLSPEMYLLFEIARLINSDETEIGSSLSTLLNPTHKNDLVEKQINIEETQRKILGNDEWFVDGMHTLAEFPYILKKQFMLPDEIFDQKLVFKELLIKRTYMPEKRFSWNDLLKEQSKLSLEKELRRQKTYILMDVSGSTKKKHRLQLEKAIIFSFLENNNKEKGEVYFRTFNQSVGELFHATKAPEYKHLINKALLPTIADGQTNLQLALETALSDVAEKSVDSDAEFLIVTDGLCKIDLDVLTKKCRDAKVHLVLLGDDEIIMSQKEVDEYVRDKFKNEYQQIDKSNSKADAEKKKAYLDHFHESDKVSIQKEIEYEIRNQLKELCRITNGTFIHIHDLPKTVIDYERIIKQVEEEIAQLQQFLISETLTPLEKERILQEYIALKNYLNSLLKEKSVSNKQKEQLKEAGKDMLVFLQENEIVLQMLKDSKIKLQFSSADLAQMKDIGLFELFKLVFYKLKTYFISRSSD